MSNFQKLNLTQYLMSRGDRVEIVAGVLVIESASGLEVPTRFLSDHREQLTREILKTAGKDGFIYTGYKTGNYLVNGSTRRDGVTLNFENILNGQYACVTHNVNLTRERNSKSGKAGSPLQNGHFRVKPNYKFCKLWKSLGLALPRRLSSFHDYMGNLKGLVFFCKVDPVTSKIIDKKVIRVTVTTEELLRCLEFPTIHTHKPRTIAGQATDYCRTRTTDKEFTLPQLQQGLEPNQSACEIKCEISKQGNAYTRGNVIPLFSCTKKVQEQSTEEWLADYGD